MSQGLKRLAVVIGNSDYQYLTEIPNAVRDAEAVEKTLSSLGFKVTCGLNKERKEIFEQFTNVRDEWKNEASEIVFYFSGHGISVDGKVYLGPVEAEVDMDFIDENFLGVEKIINFFLNNRKDDKHPIIIILDCCRSTVDVGRTRGYSQDPLQRMRGDNNTKTNMTNVAILYSTADGQVAQDGDDIVGNSPYTKLLLENIKKNYAISEIHSEIAKSLSKGTQTPWIYHSLHEPYRFSPTKSSISFNINVTVKNEFHGVPPRNNGYINRPKIISKIETLLDNKSKGNILALYGLGGMGKTELTLYYCYLHRDAYKYIFWLEADSLATTLDSFRELAINLGLDEKSAMEGSKDERIIECVCGWLEKLEGWLLLLNNVGDPIKLFGLLPRIGGDIILTTREYVSPQKAKIITVGKMEEDEALSLLLGTAEMNSTNHENSRYVSAKEIVIKLDSMALAVDLARAYIESMSITPEKYLTMFNNRREILSSYQDEDNLHKYNHSLKTVWQLSFDRIRTQSTLASEIMKISSFLHPDRIPTSLFEQQYALLTSSSSVSQSSVISETSTKSLNAVQEAISILVKSSFATKTSTNGYPMNEFLTIHRLVQKVIHDELSDEQKIRIAYNLSKALRNEISFSDPYASSTRAKMSAYLSHIRHFSGMLDMDKISLLSRDLWELLMDTVRYLLYNEEYFGMEELAIPIVSISEAIHGPEDPLTVTSLYYQARLYKYQGNYAKAEPLYQRALKILEKVRGPKHLDTAASLDNLALLYKIQGSYTKAEPLYQRALAIREDVLGSEHPETAVSLNNLAALYENQGNYSKAEPLYERALVISEKTLGPEHPDMALILNNLANLYKSQANYTKASPLFQRALAIQEKVLGPEHPDTAISLNNLALLYEDQGDYNEAESFYQWALAIREKVLGPEHLSTAISLNNLAFLYKNGGNYADSEPLYQRALAIREKLLGPEHPDTVRSLNNLASLYDSKGDYAKAKLLCQRVLTIQEKVLGLEHPDTAISLNNLALLCVTPHDYIDAYPRCKRAVQIFEKTLGSGHPNTVKCRRNRDTLWKIRK